MPDFNSFDPPKPPQKPLDKNDIKSEILKNARGFVTWLFGGRALVHGNEARIGSVLGEKGQSLSIDLKTGLWFDHATKEKGDILELYVANARVPFQQALEEIATEWLRREVPFVRHEKTAWQRIAEAKERLGDRPHTLHLELGARVAVWKYYDLSGNVVASVERYEPGGVKTYRPWCFKKGADGKERWMMGAPDMRPLFNLPAIAKSPSVVLVEGEKAAEALISVGIAATTAMQGAMAPVERTDWGVLHGKPITIWPDNDGPGIEYAERVARHLGGLGCSVTILDPVGHADKWDAADCVAEGGDADEFIRTSVRHIGDDRFRTYSLKELQNRPKPRLLVDKAIPENSVGMFWAPSGQFKTFVVIDLMLCIAHGIPWHGLAVLKPGPVLYYVEEDDPGAVKRMTGWHRMQEREEADVDRLQLHIGGLTLAEDVDEIIKTATKMGAVFIVIETVAMVFGGGNENATQDMSLFVKAAHRIRRETGAAVAVVHHTGRQEDRERGNVALRAACDWIFRIRRIEGTRMVDVVNEMPEGKQKNMETLPAIRLEMKTVSFQYQGEEETTLYPALSDRTKETGEETGGSSVYERKPRKERVGWVQKEILAVLEDAGMPLSRGRIRSHFSDLDHGTFGRTIRNLIDKRVLEEIQVDGESMLRAYSR